jgi:hypothetical protein
MASGDSFGKGATGEHARRGLSHGAENGDAHHRGAWRSVLGVRLLTYSHY